MKTLVIVGHPDLKNSVVNKAWLECLKKNKNEDVTIRVLCEELQPDGTFNIAEDQRLIEAHDRIVFQFPVYWFSMPGFMKVWIDEVLTAGWSYGPGGDKLKGKIFEVAATGASTAHAYDDTRPGHFSLDTFLSSIKGTARFVQGKFGRLFARYDVDIMGLNKEELEKSAKEFVEFINSEPTL